MEDDGFYWVWYASGDWVVQERKDGAWYACGDDEPYREPYGTLGPKIVPPPPRTAKSSRVKQQAMTPRDHTRILLADRDYVAPPTPTAEEVATALQNRSIYEAKRVQWREQHPMIKAGEDGHEE